MARSLPDNPQTLQRITDAALGRLHLVILPEILAEQGGSPHCGAIPQLPRVCLNDLINERINNALRSGGPPTARRVGQPAGYLKFLLSGKLLYPVVHRAPTYHEPLGYLLHALPLVQPE
jgi:hypothetical protein